LNMKIHFKRF